MEQLVHTFLLMLEGTEITLEIFFVTLILSLPIGMLAALGRLSSIKLISRIVEFYIWIMRGTPLMLQLLFVYFALPMIGIRLPDIAAALLAFTLNYAAYFAEIFRAGIQAVPKGQYEAAKTLGMSYPQTMRRIILATGYPHPFAAGEQRNHQSGQGYITGVYPRHERPLLRVARTIVQREFDMTPVPVCGDFLSGHDFCSDLGL